MENGVAKPVGTLAPIFAAEIEQVPPLLHRVGQRDAIDRRGPRKGGREQRYVSARQTGRTASVATTTSSHAGHSPTPTTVTSGSPTSSAHMRVASVSKQGLLGLEGVAVIWLDAIVVKVCDGGHVRNKAARSRSVSTSL